MKKKNNTTDHRGIDHFPMTGLPQTRTHARGILLRLCLLLLFVLTGMNVSAKLNGSGFTVDRLIKDITWNQEKGYVEFRVLFYHVYSGSNNDEFITDATISLYDAYTVVNKITIGAILGKNDDNSNFNVANLNINGDAIKGRLYAYALGSSTNLNTISKNTTSSEYEITGTKKAYTFQVVTASGDDKGFSYAIFRYYPGEMSQDGNIFPVILGYTFAEENTSSGTRTVNLGGGGPLKSVASTMPAAPTMNITGGLIQSGGGAHQFNCSASTTVSEITLLKNGVIIDGPKPGYNVTFTDKYLNGDNGWSEYQQGVPFSFYAYSKVSDGRTTYRYSSSSITSQRTGAVSDYSKIIITQGTCGTLGVAWLMSDPTSATGANTEGFDMQVRYGNSGWTSITSGLPTYQNTAGGISNYSYTYEIPSGQLNKGIVDYEFRVKRKFAVWDDPVLKHSNGTYYFQAQGKKSIDTNYKQLTGISIAPETGGYPVLKWSMTTNGFECATTRKLTLKVDSKETDISSALTDGFYQTSAAANNGIISCTNQQYELILEYGSIKYTYVVNTGYVMPTTTPPRLNSITASKGYYSDYVNVKWQLEPGYDSFSRFRLWRKEMGNPNAQEVLVSEMSHSGGLMQYSYDDHNINAGIYYTYTVEGFYSCNTVGSSLRSPEDIGFSQPFGSISGRITYAGSQAVKDVQVNLITEDALRGNRQLEFSKARSGSNNIDNTVVLPETKELFSRDGFSTQFWIRVPQRVSGTSYVLSNSFLRIGFTPNLGATDSDLSFGVDPTAVYIKNFPFGEYIHLSVTMENKSGSNYNQYEMKIYMNGVLNQTVNCTLGDAAQEVTTVSTIGYRQYGLSGTMDDIRIWDKILTAEEIAGNYDRVLSGKEANLQAYYRCDETDVVQSALYDCSAEGNSFHGRHAVKMPGVMRVDVPTNATHLALKGVTNANGIYMITNAIPYTSQGTLYEVVPSFGIHSFDPSSSPLYFTPKLSEFNNIDFTDISSFPVSGKVTYSNSNYPVDSVTISIDGMPANKDGKAIMTNADGEFTVDVPIGSHFISVSKNGHTFVNEGRFPANSLEKYNFQNSLSGLEFTDITTVRLMGRVAGGQPETDKPLGFGLSKANIGKATITLQTINGVYRLNMTNNDSIVANNVIGGKNSMTTFKSRVAGSMIEIETNPETGEFLAVLPPVPFQLTGVKTADFTDTGVDGDVVDFSVSKSVFEINPLMAMTAEYTNPETGEKQTFAYHDSVKITRYNAPTIIVEDRNAVPGAFGDSTYIHENKLTGVKDTVSLYSVNGNTIDYALGVPVFTQKKLTYTWKITGYEEYENNDSGEPVVDHVPLAGKEIDIANAMAAERIEVYEDTYLEIPGSREDSNTLLTLDSVGTRDYGFKVGFPNMAGDHQLAIKFSLNSNGMIYSWEKIGILLGQMPSDGYNFVTEGPDYVDIVLHDPPGSNSSASIEEGSSFSHTVEHTDITTITEDVELTIHAGPKIQTVTGIGFALINDAYSAVDIVTGTQFEQEITDNNSRKTTITFNQKISTSSDPSYVGSMADIYIGRSTNLVYGLVNQLALYPTIEKPAGTVASETVGNYSLFNQPVNTANVEFGTMFTYTQTHLIDHQIPQWKELRNQLIMPVAVLPDINSIVWGDDKVKYASLLSRDDADFGLPGTYTKYTKPEATGNDTIDRVALYNTNVLNWEQRIRDNEETKVRLFEARAEHEQNAASSTSDAYWNNKRFFENVSFDAGVQIGKNIDVSYESADISQKLYTGGGFIGAGSGLTFNNVGFELKAKVNGKRQWGNQYTDTENNTMKFSYILSESESVSFAGKDALSVDVYGPVTQDVTAILKGDTIHNLHGYVFRTRAGQTSCPFEPADSTLYYKNTDEKSYLLNYGTFRIEYPELMINGQRDTTSVDNISAGREATFTLQMSNISEAGVDVTYQIYPDNATNPDGLILMLDGEALTQARQIRIPYGQTLTKTLKVRQSSLDILDYSGVGIKLGSVCDTDNFSEVFLKLSFIPASSPVTLTSTSRLANRELLDNAGKITFTVSDYDRTFRNFGLLRMQYRSTSSENWMTLKEYVNDPNLYPVTGDRELIGTRGSISYDYEFDEKTPSDGDYLFRVLAVSLIGNGEVYTSSDEITVVKDVRAPQLLGNAAPVNGILNTGDEISLTFNEDIQSGLLTPDKFTITGILNADIRTEPTVGLAFTGTEKAYTELPVYAGGSFAIETWFRRPGNTAGTLFAFGEGDGYISLGFDVAGHAVVTIGSETKTSANTIQASEVWKYGGLSYNRNTNTVSVYMLEEAATFDMFLKEQLIQQPATQGKLYVGNNAAGNNGFRGSVGWMHFYSATRSSIDASASKYAVKSGNEPNLVGLWEMEEGEGTIAKDKARSRHLLLNNSSWYIYPRGRSLAFNGTSNYATITSGTFPFRSYDDFSWEFWFKGANQGAATLFSCGTAAYIGFNAAHQLILTNANGNISVLTENNLLDDQWHHFTLSVKRNGMLSAVIDGKVTTSVNSNLMEGPVGAGFYYLGTKYKYDLGQESYSEHFRGNIDEFRVWGSALTTEAIVLDKNHKLRGTEAGLKAYYPFESYQKRDQLIEVYESLDDVVDPTNKIGEMTAVSTVAAPLKDARPVKNVPFTFVASERKIVLNITEEEYRIDNVSLKITADKVLDMHNNPSSTFTWVAYVNRSPLNWLTDPVNISMAYGESKSFKASIQNSAGTASDYYIEDLPSWLSVNAPSGTLQPLATKELTFSIYPGINIGNYEASIVLKGANDVQKILPVVLRVTGEQPDWSVNLADFEQTMTVTGQIRIENVPQEDESDILAAFIGELCVGVASPKYEPSFNSYFVYMTIGGNTEHDNQNVTFKLWDASSGNVYPVIDLIHNSNTLNLRFRGDDTYGTTVTPVYFNAQNVIEQSIALITGWNWISANLTHTNPVLIDQFKTNTAGYVTQIKAGNESYLNNNNGNWAGLLSSLVPEQMYAVRTTKEATLHLIGTPVKPVETPITLEANKWNWIGYTPQFSLPVSDALAGITNPAADDQVKNKSSYRIMSSNGWVGSMNTMKPGVGYKYKSGNSQQFRYPSAPATLRSSSAGLNEEYMLYQSKWEVDYQRFSENMTVTASIHIDNVEITDGWYEIAAFSNGECRGSAMMQYINGFVHPYMGFLMVHGERNEGIEFRIFNHETGLEYMAGEKLPFAPDASYGTPDELFILRAGAPTEIDTVEDSQITIFPNPVEKNLFIRHNLSTLERIEIFDISGKLHLLKENFEDKSINVSSLKEGTYFIHVTLDGQRFVNKFIKK